MRSFSMVVVAAMALLGVGCASYTTPGPAADMTKLGATEAMKRAGSEPSINAEFDKKPLASFPASVAVIHVQGPAYRSYTWQRDGNTVPGNYTVITKREAESDANIERLQKLPMVAGIAPMNKMLFGGPVNTEADLRRAAARVQADITLIYTFDTRFYVKDYAAPMSVVTLGLSPNKQAKVSTTASAILLDTRSGYIYGLAESTAESDQIANAWTSSDAVDDTRRRTERDSFNQLVGELEKSWAGVVKQHAKPLAKG